VVSRYAIDDGGEPRHHSACVSADGGHFEHYNGGRASSKLQEIELKFLVQRRGKNL